MTDTLERIVKHQWIRDEREDGTSEYHCEKCGYRRTFNPNIDYTGFSVPFPLTGYANMNYNESLYGECIEKR